MKTFHVNSLLINQVVCTCIQTASNYKVRLFMDELNECVLHHTWTNTTQTNEVINVNFGICDTDVFSFISCVIVIGFYYS